MADNNPDVLLPCPFCGSDLVGSTWARMTDECQYYGVCCFDCKASLNKATAAEAIAAWNTRAPAVSEEAVERVAIRRDVFDFLMGTGALGGYYFGESRPDMRGAFWWRTIMRATLSPTTPTEEPQS